MCVFVQSLFGQSQIKKKLTQTDFDKWSTLAHQDISPYGNWVTFKLEYDSGKDTLFLKNSKTDKSFFFPNGNSASFSMNERWFKVKQRDTLMLLNLISGEKKRIGTAFKSDFIMKGQYILVAIKESGGQKLLIFNLDNGKVHKLEKVREYAISEDKKSVAYIAQDNTVKLLRPNGGQDPITILRSTKEIRKNLVWGETNNSLSLLEEFRPNDSSAVNHIIHFFKNVHGTPESYSLDPMQEKSIGMVKKILAQAPLTPLSISTDDKRIFFYVEGNKRKHDFQNEVEIWDSKDKLEFTRDLLEGDPESRPKLMVWCPESKKILEISNNQYYSVYLTPDYNRAIIYNPHQYEPQNEVMGPSDFWSKDLSSGKSKLLLKRQSGKVKQLGVSPNSKYIHYYKNSNWWLLDIESGTHILLTEGMEVQDNSDNRGDAHPPFGFVGWSEDSKSVLLYTQFDVWLISVDGKKKESLTNGQRDGKTFRVCTQTSSKLKIHKRYDFIGEPLKLDKGIILEVFDMKSKANGYYIWTREKGLENIISHNSRLQHIRKASRSDAYIVTEEKVDKSPRIIYFDEFTNAKVIVSTNIQQEQYEWTKSELISYRSSEGKSLEGVLLYPSNYIPGKKYPMVVQVYEKQSHKLHHYYSPSLYNEIGFNPTIYTSDGYFVLLPDITYIKGRVGYSALDCVETAVKKTINMGIVNGNNVGLIGHSFGGYETNFIITKSSLFSAAVAGAGLTDLVSNSLSISSGRSRMWRYETHQMRMGKSLYEDYENFSQNSPIVHANKIHTPLLSWTGKNDYQVDPHQSIMMHMAMRSLKKTHYLLLYPNETHVIRQSRHQKDLSLKTKSWFDHYLKGLPLSDDLK